MYIFINIYIFLNYSHPKDNDFQDDIRYKKIDTVSFQWLNHIFCRVELGFCFSKEMQQNNVTNTYVVKLASVVCLCLLR